MLKDEKSQLKVMIALDFFWLSQSHPPGGADLSWRLAEVAVVYMGEVSQFVFGVEGR